MRGSLGSPRMRSPIWLRLISDVPPAIDMARFASTSVAAIAPGPEGNIAKLLLSEIGHETAAIMAELAGPDAAFLKGDGAMAATLMLMHRAMSIAGGTSEIKRNQIAERILGLPRDPLIK